MRAHTHSSERAHPAAFSIAARDLDGHTRVLAVAGDLDLLTAPDLRAALIDSLSDGCTYLLVDLSRVTFMDSTALGVLIGVNRRLPAGAQLAIVCARERLIEVFRLSGTDSVFAIHPTLDHALAQPRGASRDAAEDR